MAEIFFTSKNQDEMHLTSFGQWTPLVRNTGNKKICYSQTLEHMLFASVRTSCY